MLPLSALLMDIGQFLDTQGQCFFPASLAQLEQSILPRQMPTASVKLPKHMTIDGTFMKNIGSSIKL